MINFRFLRSEYDINYKTVVDGIDSELETSTDDNEMGNESPKIASESETRDILSPPSQSVHDEFVDALESRLVPLVNCIPDDRLQSFRFVI